MGIFDKFFKETQESIDWPNDADGDVLRRMKESGFDFSKIHSIDFNIDSMLSGQRRKKNRPETHFLL